MSVDVEIYKCYGVSIADERGAEETDKISFLYTDPSDDPPVLVVSETLEHLGASYEKINYVLEPVKTNPQWDKDIKEFCDNWKIKYSQPAWRIVVCVG